MCQSWNQPESAWRQKTASLIIKISKNHPIIKKLKNVVYEWPFFNVDIFYTEKFNVKWKSGSVISRDNMKVRLYFDGMNKKFEKIKSMKWKRKEKWKLSNNSVKIGNNNKRVDKFKNKYILLYVAYFYVFSSSSCILICTLWLKPFHSHRK